MKIRWIRYAGECVDNKGQKYVFVVMKHERS